MIYGRITATLLIAAAAALAQRPNRSGGQNPDQTNPLGHTAEVVGRGKELYNSSCTMCHGIDGTAGDRAPALASRRRYLRSTNAQLFDAVKNGIPGTAMPAMRLPDEDIWRIVAYIRSLRATASDEFVEGDVAHGQTVFEGKGGCSACHMIQGRGGLLGPDLSNIGGERSLRSLRASLTDRSTPPIKGFQPVRITTKSGKVIDGIVKNEDSFSLQVMDRKSELQLLVRDDLKDVGYGENSLMPRDYDKRLTPTELQDLLAYLSRQARGRAPRRQASAAADRAR